MEKQQSLLRLYQIPFLEDEEANQAIKERPVVIGILDSSGSMCGQWQHVARCWNELKNNLANVDIHTVAFSDQAMLIEGQVNSDINKYGNMGTNIIEGFRIMESIVLSYKKIENLTIIFVSDGHDNNNSTISKRVKQLSPLSNVISLNFICIGIGSGFPTFLSMDLRQMYHSGSGYIPACFLVNKPEEYDTTFLQVSEFLHKNKKVQVIPQVYRTPWEQPVNEINEGSWVLTDADYIAVDGIQFAVTENITLDSLEQVFRGWVQTLQLSSLNKETEKSDLLKQNTKICLETMTSLRYKLDEIMNKLYKQSNDTNQKMTFKQRLLIKQSKRDQFMLDSLVKEVKGLYEGNILSKLTEQEAAKRLAIGTKVGKYHQNALKIRGLTVEEFLLVKQNFLEMSNKFSLNLKNSQLEPSVILLQTQKEVFLETDFTEGLNMCQNQYELVETLPLIGYSLNIKRTDASMINPWSVQVLSIAKHHKVFDTVSIQTNNNCAVMSIGADEQELINAVLPIITENDIDLKPYLNSKLFNILMTFNVMQNADTLFMNAYTALLGSTLYYLLTLVDSEWRNQLLVQVHTTIKLLYGENKGFKEYLDTLINKPNIAVVTEHPDITSKCEDLSKAVMSLYYITKEGICTDQNKIEQILYSIIAEFFGRVYPREESLESYFTIENKEVLKNIDFSKDLQRIREKFQNPTKLGFYTSQELKSAVFNEILTINSSDNGDNIKLQPKLKSFYKTDFKVNLVALETIFKYFTGKDIDQEKYISFLNHAFLYGNSYQRNSSDINMDTKQILNKIQGNLLSDFFESKRKKDFEDIWLDIYAQYRKEFSEIHKQIYPVSEGQLQEFCKNNNYKVEQYFRIECSTLFRNACCSIDCPFYLQPRNDMSQHIYDNSYAAPAFHKTIMKFDNLSAEELYQKILNGDCTEKNRPAPFINKDKVIAEKDDIIIIIEQVRIVYKNL